MRPMRLGRVRVQAEQRPALTVNRFSRVSRARKTLENQSIRRNCGAVFERGCDQTEHNAASNYCK
jgi:hypothetical protein